MCHRGQQQCDYAFSGAVLGLALLTLGACDPGSEQPVDRPSAGGKADEADDGEGDGLQAQMHHVATTRDRVVVQGHLVELAEDGSDIAAVTPMSELQRDMARNRVLDVVAVSDAGTVELGTVVSNLMGAIDASFDLSSLDLPRGRVTLEMVHEGVVVGEARAFILDEDDSAVAVRSDIDLTYLDTNFQGAAALANLMIETAEDKTTLPAMDRVFQHLEAGEQRPLTFVSASPSFFERVLERKMVLDGIEHDGIALKKFGNVIFSDLLDFDPGSIVADLENQIGYKLVTLLQLRAELPASMPEVLLGDDSEADFVVYNLYDRLLRHELDVTELDALLEALTVNHHWREQIAARLPEVLAEDPAPPLVLYVRATDQGSGHFAYEEWERPTMHRHAGTWALALDLFEESLLDESAVLDIRDGLFEQGLSASDLAAEADAAAFVDPDTAEQFR